MLTRHVFVMSSDTFARPLLLATLFFLVNFWSLPLAGVWGSSEAREAHVIELMNTPGQSWVLPSRNGFVPSKPPLFHWFGATLAPILGLEGHVAGRVVSLIFASLIVYLTCLTASQFRTHPPQLAALISCFVLTTSWGFLSMARTSMVDMCFAFFVSCALLLTFSQSLKIANDSTFRSLTQSYRLAFYLLIGLAILAKGPLGAALIFVCASAMILCLPFARAKVLYTLWRPQFAWMLTILLALAWYLPAFLEGRGEFLGRQVVFENIARLFGGDNINSKPIWFYFTTIASDAMPWALVALLLYFFKLKKSVLEERILFASSVAGFVLFSLASGKRSPYLLPLYPLLALLLTKQLVRCLESFADSDWGRLNIWLKRFALSLLIVLLAILIFADVFRLPIEINNLKFIDARAFVRQELSVAEWPLIASALLLVCCMYSRHLKRQIIGIWIALVVAISTLAAVGLSLKSHFKGFDLIAYRVNAHIKDQCLIAARDRFDEFLDPVFYYLRRPVQVIAPDAAIPQEGCYILASTSWFESRSDLNTKDILRLQLHIDALSQRKDRDLLLARVSTDFSEPEKIADFGKVSAISWEN